MKKVLLSAAIFFAACIVFGTAETHAQTSPQTGAYAKVEKSDVDVKAAVDFAVKEKGENFRVVKIKKAERQVVAGMNFRVKMKVAEKTGDKESKYTVTAVIYRDLEGNYSLTSWEKASKY